MHEVRKAGQLLVTRERVALQPEGGASSRCCALPQLCLPLGGAAGLQQALHDGKAHELGVCETRRQLPLLLLLLLPLLLVSLLACLLLRWGRLHLPMPAPALRLLAAVGAAAAAAAAAAAVFGPQASQLSQGHLP